LSAEASDRARLKVFVGDVHAGTFGELREKVARLENLGVDGYLHGDHLFMRGDDGEVDVTAAADPFSTLAAVGALSERLILGTLVANVGLCHPALVLRHFAQLAALFGGDRVLAGIGAGWNAMEFEALGDPMPSIAHRMDQLAGAAELARAWFDTGSATMRTPTFGACELPIAPPLDMPPRLMVGGGSRRLMEIAGRYADHVDLHPLSRRRPDPSGTGGELRRFLETTMSDVQRCVEALEAAEQAAGRASGTVGRSMWMGPIAFSDGADGRAAEQQLCRSAGLEAHELRQCPYVLLGEPSEMANLLADRRERLGLDAVVVGAGPELDRFMTEVVPRLA
jgi:alkanesulfonate monooxygenase SsuD/methylene tetrahydromethanopterin reductase-like flavin-dependent oxidoreductase (luciferase family)